MGDHALMELAPAKLTLGLRITGRRPDGYHELATVMTTVSLCDEVSLIDEPVVLIEDPTGRITRLEHAYGAVPRDDTNSAMRALRLTGRKGGVRIIKRIPFGAGLGGGSADAAAVLRLVGFEPTEAELLSLGADVPFCYHGGRAFVRGIGEEIEFQPRIRERYVLVLVPLLVSTADVYRVFDQLVPDESLDNHLWNAAAIVEPRLRALAHGLRDLSGAMPRLAGSGSTMYLPGSIEDYPEIAQHGHLPTRIAGMLVEFVDVVTV
jgi:4-diphosphocytidyl-2-C-methyl-D-erythritol kinase